MPSWPSSLTMNAGVLPCCHSRMILWRAYALSRRGMIHQQKERETRLRNKNHTIILILIYTYTRVTRTCTRVTRERHGHYLWSPQYRWCFYLPCVYLRQCACVPGSNYISQDITWFTPYRIQKQWLTEAHCYGKHFRQQDTAIVQCFKHEGLHLAQTLHGLLLWFGLV